MTAHSSQVANKGHDCLCSVPLQTVLTYLLLLYTASTIARAREGVASE